MFQNQDVVLLDNKGAVCCLYKNRYANSVQGDPTHGNIFSNRYRLQNVYPQKTYRKQKI